MKEKKKKLNLDELQVQSFVTSFEISNGETQDIKGGYTHECQSGQLGCGANTVAGGTCQHTCGGACSDCGGGNCGNGASG
ncbi:MAG: pinensin family lanthipeptide [Balneolaceae bacterium]